MEHISGKSVVNQGQINVSGPTNHFLLSHDNKKINFLMNFPESKEEQTKCENSNTKIDKYLEDIFKNYNNENKTLDFFLQIGPGEINAENVRVEPVDDSKHIYIDNVKTLYYKYLRDATKTKNIRLHYIDVRNYIAMDTFSLINDIENSVGKKYLNNIHNILNPLNYILLNLYFMKKVIDHIDKTRVNKDLSKYDLIKFNLTDFVETIEKVQSDKNFKLFEDSPTFIVLKSGIFKILTKILTKYKDDNVKKHVLIIFETVKKLLNHVLNITEKLYTYVEIIVNNINKYDDNPVINFIDRGEKKYGSNYVETYRFAYSELQEKECVDHISNVLLEMYNNMWLICAKIMDCFFLRRLLNNVDMVNSIVYTNSANTVFFVWFLTKYFDYKIDEYFYIKNDDIDAVHKIIKNNDDHDKLIPILVPEKIVQCITITGSD